MHPFTCVVVGPTGCGKTTFVSRFARSLFHTDKRMIQKHNVVLRGMAASALYFVGDTREHKFR